MESGKGLHPISGALSKPALFAMKVQTALLQAIGLALLASSCQSKATEQTPGASRQQVRRDSCVKPKGATDTTGRTDSLERRMHGNGDYCPACGMG